MEPQKIHRTWMDPGTTLKVKITVEAIFDDLLEFVSQPLVKVILWLMSVVAAFVVGLAF